MTAPRAADLPVGSVVAINGVRYTRQATEVEWPWQSADAGPVYSDDGVQDALDNRSAQVLRVGDGSGL